MNDNGDYHWEEWEHLIVVGPGVLLLLPSYTNAITSTNTMQGEGVLLLYISLQYIAVLYIVA